VRYRAAAATCTIAASLVFAASAIASEVQPSSHDYGSQNVGSGGAAMSFTLYTSSNICSYDDISMTCTASTGYATDTSALGGDPGSTTKSGDFSIHNVDCPYPTYPAPPATFPGSGLPGTCHFEVSFVPSASGARGRTLSFPDTSGASGALALSGNGVGSGAVAAAVKKCKKKFRKGSSKRKKCLRHARQLAG
jgi:hypothetical protein